MVKPPGPLQRIRDRYKIPVKRGTRIYDAYSGTHGVVTSAKNGRLMIRRDGWKFSIPYHPTWMIDYLDDSGAVVASFRD
ncbi:hypothetical protein [Kordiimonas sp.]|uniref:hypothetical protein n=1 Tax=Kordiimonas sp. TaxID=1970157 RepID=UPI003A92479A